jgi:hypothetical protein
MKNYLIKLLLSIKQRKIKSIRSGSALILTMFILAGMMIVALSGSYVVLVGIKSGGIQSQSVKAYFMAESGAERLLYELRKKGTTYGNELLFSNQPVLEEEFASTNSAYHVFFMNRTPLIYHSIGTHQNTKRNVELRL